MSSPLTKTPTKSERTRQFMESALKRIADSEQKHQEDMKALTEQFEAALKDDEDEPETISEVQDQVDYEPKQLLTDLTLKETAAHDSIQDDDSPSAERLTTLVDSDDGGNSKE